MNHAEYQKLIKTMTLQQRADLDRKLREERRKRDSSN